MLGSDHIVRDFRLKGYTGQNMVSPRQPVLSKSPDDRQRNEDHMMKFFGKSSFFDPEEDESITVNDPRIAKPRIDEGHRGMQYGTGDYDRGYPHPRPLHDPFNGDRSETEAERMRKQKQDMELDIRQLKARQMREKLERDEEKKRTTRC
ncbi:hypothetical protein PoB_001437800 [Plakobranchus ocellatus]|uniref:Uncharacterized protein n=1 Tax=Plakobranchus ocellatus TaxID=259542 RepID=A0AAV3YZC8_9GAST|nr:hypothetical protein PoB_001437800 [Plakobranchus ocellatus]